MNETTQNPIELLKTQISLRDNTINTLTRENEVQSIVIRSLKNKYKTIIFIYTTLLLIFSGIEIYNLIFK